MLDLFKGVEAIKPPIIRLSISGYTSSKISDKLKKEGRDGEEILIPFIDGDAEKAIFSNYLRHRNKQEGEFYGLVDGLRENIQLPLGVVVIMGPSNSGKSLIARYIQKQLNARYLSFHEPELPSLLAPETAIAIIEDFINGSEDFLIIDSFRFFLYNSDRKAAAISGGISANLFTDITTLSNIAAAYGKTIIIVLNFLSQSQESRATIQNAMIGASAGVIDTNLITEIGSFRYSARTDQNKRKEIIVTIPLNEEWDELGDNSSKEATFLNSQKDDFATSIFLDAKKVADQEILDLLNQIKL